MIFQCDNIKTVQTAHGGFAENNIKKGKFYYYVQQNYFCITSDNRFHRF